MDAAPKHFDVIIVGAGLSGIGAACHLSQKCPDKSYAVLEARAAMGGTWDLFRYPGIRSDSDMFTLGYNFKPWTDSKAIADGPAILEYINDAAAEYNVTDHIHYGHKITHAQWDSETVRWTLTIEGRAEPLSCNFLSLCAGYYNYEHGHLPEFAGRESFKGEIVHPQFWTEDVDYKDKRVVVIGSGATAVTLVPELAKQATHVTMLQRSPTYIGVLPREDGFANLARKVLPANTAYKLSRWKNIVKHRFEYNFARKKPEKTKEHLRKDIIKYLGEDYDVDTHFKPDYNPWDQRVCLVPDGDMFHAIKDGHASVVTDHIERFDETGIALKSGEYLEADLIVTATGIEVIVLGNIQFTVDGASVDVADSFGYKGMMFSGMPNLISVFGYTNASWTLRADLLSEYMCRLLTHMDETGKTIATPMPPEGMEPGPWLDFQAGYIQRVIHKLPKLGDRDPWRNTQDYKFDKVSLGKAPIEDGHLVLT